MRKVLKNLLIIFLLLLFFLAGVCLGIPELDLLGRLKLFFFLFSIAFLVFSIFFRIVLWRLEDKEGFKYKLRREIVKFKALIWTAAKMLTLVVFLGITIVSLYKLVKVYINEGFFTFLLYVLGFVAFSILIFLAENYLRKRKHVKLFQGLHFIVGVTTVLILNFLFPMFLLVGYVFFLLFISFGVLFILLMELRYLNVLNFSLHGIYFICFVFGTISVVHLSEAMRKLVECFLPINSLIEGMNERFKKLMSYLLREECLDALMFMGYAVFLLMTTFYQLTSNKYLISSQADKAVVQSFLVYIAFTNAKGKLKIVNFSINELFNKFMNVTLKQQF